MTANTVVMSPVDTMRLTILRCPPYAYHEPHHLGAKARYDWVDQGYRSLRWCCGRTWAIRDAGVVEAARALNLPIVPITMHAHPGQLPGQASLLALSSPEMEMTALKAAEDGDGAIVRLADRHGHGATGTLHWLDQAFAVTLQPFAVETFRFSPRRAVAIAGV